MACLGLIGSRWQSPQGCSMGFLSICFPNTFLWFFRRRHAVSKCNWSVCRGVMGAFCKCGSDEFDERGGGNQNKDKKCCKDYVEIKSRCRLGYCCRACWHCLLPCWGRNLSRLKAFTRALRISLCSSVLQDTHLRGKLLKPPLSFIELLLLWEKNIL